MFAPFGRSQQESIAGGARGWRAVWQGRSRAVTLMIVTVGAALLLVAAWSPWIGMALHWSGASFDLGGNGALSLALPSLHHIRGFSAGWERTAWDLAFLLGLWLAGALWLALLTALTLIGAYGASLEVNHPPALTFSHDPIVWVNGLGGFVAGVGLALGWLAVVGALMTMVVRRRRM